MLDNAQANFLTHVSGNTHEDFSNGPCLEHSKKKRASEKILHFGSIFKLLNGGSAYDLFLKLMVGGCEQKKLFDEISVNPHAFMSGFSDAVHSSFF